MLDHIVYGTPNLAEGVARLERLLGVRAAFGGKHAGAGTHNALLSLGESSYLEVIAPDPDQRVDGVLPFGVTTGMTPRLVGWAVRTAELTAQVARARAAGYDPGRIRSMSRARPDGVQLSWRLTLHPPGQGSFLIPFLIDWGDTPHPARTAPSGARLAGLQLESPEPDVVRARLAALDVQVPVTEGAQPTLTCTLRAAHGEVRLT